MDKGLFDHFALMSSKLTNAQASSVGICDESGVLILGNDGPSWKALGANFSLAFLGKGDVEVVYIPDVKRDSRLRHHPMIAAIQTLRRLIYVPVITSQPGINAGIVIYDPDLRSMTDTVVMRTLPTIGVAFRAALELYHDISDPRRRAAGPKTAPSSSKTAEVAWRLLLETLNRAGAADHVPDVAVCRYLRRELHARQLADFEVIKSAMPDATVDLVADEILEVVKSERAGIPTGIAAVAAVHDRGDPFLTRVTTSVAADLRVPIFAWPASSEKAAARKPRTPARTARMPTASGTLLIVDDIARAKGHYKSLITRAAHRYRHVAVIAWLGAGSVVKRKTGQRKS